MKSKAMKYGQWLALAVVVLGGIAVALAIV
jgi:hypothetical protein